MSLVDVRGYNFIPGLFAKTGRGTSTDQSTLDADGEKCGGIFYVPKTGNISKIGIFVGWTASFVTDTLKVSIQGVDASNGRPDGVVAASGTLSTPAQSTIYWVELDSPLAVTIGQKKAIVVEFNDWVGEGSDGNLVIIQGVANIVSYANTILPYAFRFMGGAWSFREYTPNFGFEYDDGTIEPTLGLLPAVAPAHYDWDMNDNPDRRGLRFQVPYACRIVGAYFTCDMDINANLILYDSDGITPVPGCTITFDSDVRQSTVAGCLFAHFTSTKILTKDTYYRLALLPTEAGTDIKLYYFTVTDDGANKAMNAVDGGVYFHYTSCNGAPTAEGDWTQTLTTRPIMGLVVDQLESPDYPAVGNVRDGTDYNNATQQGTLDLPAVTDVEKGVVFDSTTKTGTFKEPGIVNVKLGVTYGAADTEFTGTYAQNVVSGAIVVGQDTVGTVIGE